MRESALMKSERQQAILDLLDQHHSVSVNEISNTRAFLCAYTEGLSFHTPPTEQPFHV